MEVIVATIIATVAVLGLAYTFGMGRAFINRFETARAAVGAANARMETLGVLSGGSPDLAMGDHSEPFVLDGVTIGETRWTVSAYDDPADGLGAADPRPMDLKRITVDVIWQVGALTDTVRVERLRPAF